MVTIMIMVTLLSILPGLVTATAAKTMTVPSVLMMMSKIRNRACNSVTGGYLDNSPGNVSSLALCADLCEASTECMGITLYADNWCGHFSTVCPNLLDSPGSTTVRLQSRTYTASWALVAYGRECDFSNGEEFLDSSSRTVRSLSQCLDSCDVAVGCRSIVFDYTSSFCSHVSTPCTNTKEAANVASFSNLKISANMGTETAITATALTTTAATPGATAIGPFELSCPCSTTINKILK